MRHEKRCKPVNLVCGQFWQKMWTFWIQTRCPENVDQKNPQISENIKKLPTQGQEDQLCQQNPVKKVSSTICNVSHIP